MSLKESVAKVGRDVSKNSPTILAVVGVVGMVTTVVLAVKATPKALIDYEDAKYEKEQKNEKFTAVDAVKTCWKHYIPTAIAGVTTGAAILCGNHVSAKRIATAGAALDIAETTLLAYKDEIKEKLGDAKAKEIQNGAVQKKVNANPPMKVDGYPTEEMNGNPIASGKCVIYDPIANDYWWGSPADVKVAVERVKTVLAMEPYVDYNDFRGFMDRPSCKVGSEYGWDCSDMGLELSTEDSGICPEGTPYAGMPYWAIEWWSCEPRTDFRRSYYGDY